eukprot:scaffold109698_cov22-Prasinocladus_malaysianus.AAC.2
MACTPLGNITGLPIYIYSAKVSNNTGNTPAAGDESAHKSLRRLAEVGVHVLAPVTALEANPVQNAVALFPLKVSQIPRH